MNSDYKGHRFPLRIICQVVWLNAIDSRSAFETRSIRWPNAESSSPTRRFVSGVGCSDQLFGIIQGERHSLGPAVDQRGDKNPAMLLGVRCHDLSALPIFESVRLKNASASAPTFWCTSCRSVPCGSSQSWPTSFLPLKLHVARKV